MSRVKNVLVTGAGGFVGSALVEHLNRSGDCSVVGCVRRETPGLGFQAYVTGDLTEFSRWDEALEGVDVVVHLAARVHILNEQAGSALTQFRRVNVDVTLELARAARRAGVKRFLYVSSIGVHGAATHAQAFTEEIAPGPGTNYAVSKLEAEEQLRRLFAGTEVELVIIRPPLVYGGKAPGNFRRLLKLTSLGIPLPFASVTNERSMLALDNLVDFLQCCIHDKSAAGQAFVIADNEALSLPHILVAIGAGMGFKVRLFKVPVKLLALGAAFVGKQSEFNQVCGSLVVDAKKAREFLGWHPPYSAQEALVKAGREFIKSS